MTTDLKRRIRAAFTAPDQAAVLAAIVDLVEPASPARPEPGADAVQEIAMAAGVAREFIAARGLRSAERDEWMLAILDKALAAYDASPPAPDAAARDKALEEAMAVCEPEGAWKEYWDGQPVYHCCRAAIRALRTSPAPVAKEVSVTEMIGILAEHWPEDERGRLGALALALTKDSTLSITKKG